MMRILALLALSAALVFAGLSPAAAQERYAAFVADMESGEVLHSRLADAPRYPASLTKMMTLYMLFDAMERGELDLQTQISVSAEAASRPPTKLAVPAGGSVSAETAIRALAIKSANDIAVAVAERLGGTESAFAAMMTARAQELGLTSTTFRNASGLPDSGQQTTARDMARLAYALRRDFPQYYPYFSERAFTHNGTTYRSHNSLLASTPGVDGLKTGYIRASGFNIAVSAIRQDHSLVAVVMGGATGPVRDAHARELVEAAFSTLDARRDGTILASLQAPRLNPIREQEILVAEASALPAPRAMGSSETAPALEVLIEDLPDLAAEPVSLAPADAGREASSGWSVQVGAFSSQAAAHARLESVAAMAPVLRRGSPVTDHLDREGRVLHRARFEALDADAAREACAALARLGEACFAVSPHA